MKTKDLSVIVPVYNGFDYIGNEIEKMLPLDNVELIIINDGSTDATDSIIMQYEKRDNIVYLKTENYGVSHARNIGLQIAQGKYICFHDVDDIFYYNKVISLLNNLEDKI